MISGRVAAPGSGTQVTAYNTPGRPWAPSSATSQPWPPSTPREAMPPGVPTGRVGAQGQQPVGGQLGDGRGPGIAETRLAAIPFQDAREEVAGGGDVHPRVGPQPQPQQGAGVVQALDLGPAQLLLALLPLAQQRQRQ